MLLAARAWRRCSTAARVTSAQDSILNTKTRHQRPEKDPAFGLQPVTAELVEGAHLMSE